MSDQPSDPVVVDVTDGTFETVVLEGSKHRPVVVDLWAEWCGPCKTLGPILEKVAADRAGAFLLAKLDTDANPTVAGALFQALRSQSIPTVAAFRDGEIVDAFIGAYPEPEVVEFVDRLLPTEAEQQAAEAEAVAEAGDLEGAEEGYRSVLEQDPGNREAGVGLASILLGRGELDAARALAEPLLPDEGAERVLARVEFAGWADLPPTTPLDGAKRAAADGRTAEALDAMLAALPTDGEAARAAMVTVFAVLGDDPLVPPYRRRLASALY
jgi:putative thioredoxin